MRHVAYSHWFANAFVARLFVLSVVIFGLNWLSWMLLAAPFSFVAFDVGIRVLARRKGFDLDDWRRRRLGA
jgi:hypothetical protein